MQDKAQISSPLASLCDGAGGVSGWHQKCLRRTSWPRSGHTCSKCPQRQVITSPLLRGYWEVTQSAGTGDWGSSDMVK